jgi:hypothetical protein
MASRDRRQSDLSLTVSMLANERHLLAPFGHAEAASRCALTGAKQTSRRRPRPPLLAIRSPCSVALDAGGVISAMRPHRHMQSRRVAEWCLRGHRSRKSAAIVRIDGEGRVLGCGRGGLRDRLPCRGGRRKERGKNERRAQKLKLVMLSSCHWRATHARAEARIRIQIRRRSPKPRAMEQHPFVIDGGVGWFNPRIGIRGSVSAVIAGDDERSAAALPLRSQDGFGDRVRSSQSCSTGT